MHCPSLRARLKFRDFAVDLLSALSARQQSWLLRNKARFGWTDDHMAKWVRLVGLTPMYPKTFPTKEEIEVYNNKGPVLNYMWPENQIYQENPVEIQVPNGSVNYPPTERHLIDVIGPYPSEAVHRAGVWPRTHTPGNQEVSLRFDGIMDALTQHLHEDSRGGTASNICLVSALLEKNILDMSVKSSVVWGVVWVLDFYGNL